MSVPDPIRAEYEASGHWIGEDLVAVVLSTAHEDPRRDAVVDDTGTYTFEEAVRLAASLASWMTSVGVRPGDVVSVQLPNWREAYVVHLAVAWIGAVANTLLPVYRTSELRHILPTCGARLLIIPENHRSRDDFVHVATTLMEEVESIEAVLVVRATRPLPAGFMPYTRAVEHRALEWGQRSDGNAPALVAFTSGTESLPKGVVHSRNTIGFGMRSLAATFGLTARDAIWAPSPIGHGTGFVWGMRLAMSLGSTLVLQDRWDPAQAARLIDEHRVVYCLAATPFAQDLLDYVETTEERHDLTSFRIFCCGGTAIPRELVQRAKRVIGAELLACWGMTECFMGSVVSPYDDEDTKTGFDGRALPGVELRTVDDSGASLGPGSEGELWVLGPNVMLGYLPGDQVPVFAPGDWLHTGDAATLDEHGRLRIVGRKKDIIIRGGVNISPAEVEEALVEHPAVHRVSVVGYPDARLGERACAFVVPAGDPPSLSDLISFLRKKDIATYKLPERLEIVDDLPTTLAGKVLKTQLRERLAHAAAEAAEHASATNQ